MYVRSSNSIAQSEKPTPSKHTRKKDDHSEESSLDRVIGVDAVDLTQFNSEEEKREQSQQQSKQNKPKSQPDGSHAELDIKV